MNPYIFGISFIWGMFKVHLYGYTPSCVHIRFKKKVKDGTFDSQILGATDLKLGMHIQIDFGNTMGWFPPSHTSSYWCVQLKMPKMEFLKNTWIKGVRPTN